MSADVEQLVAETMQVTGADAPAMLLEDSPALRSALPTDGFYLIGLIGGKDVGKSSLINALAGEAISEPSSHGPGTQQVIAYCHESQEQLLGDLLQREVPGEYVIVTHNSPQLARQVLLDLPDIDSHYASHIQITRTMLRHMLFPIWIQSIEKYADQQPQKLLARVAEGNDPKNFLFCLNKIDQAVASDGEDAAKELADDFARRIGNTLHTEAPIVYSISAMNPDEFDLPQLRSLLAREKSTGDVSNSRQLADKRRRNSLLAWIEGQHLTEQAEKLQRLENESQELLAARVTAPLLEDAIDKIGNDPAHRSAIADEVTARRAARWPIVNLVHTLLSPILFVTKAFASPEELLERHLSIRGQKVRALVQSTFAHLQQTHTMIADMYRGRKLWEDVPAEAAENELRRTLLATIDHQRDTAVERLAKRGIIAPLFRWLFTIGALLWFPIVQPLLEAFLQTDGTKTVRELALLAVQLLGATYLLKTMGFLLIYYVFIWLWIKWSSQRKVARLLRLWTDPAGEESSLNLAAQTLAWADQLINPIRDARDKMDSLVRRANDAKSAVAG
jgi:50S ribosome-binding GTPase